MGRLAAEDIWLYPTHLQVDFLHFITEFVRHAFDPLYQHIRYKHLIASPVNHES